jgi:transcription initiation factor TFIIIB Brf1 subunit/transcription initiation factor TFIIB
VASKITKEELKDALDIIENHFPSEHKQLLKKLGIPFESKEDELARRVINKEIPGTRSLFKIPVKEILTLDNVGNIMKTCPKIIKDINTVSDAKRKRIASVYREIQRVRKNLKNISPKGYELLVGLNAFLDKEVG